MRVLTPPLVSYFTSDEPFRTGSRPRAAEKRTFTTENAENTAKNGPVGSRTLWREGHSPSRSLRLNSSFHRRSSARATHQSSRVPISVSLL